MAEITAALVKQLREATGSGMMDCKNALKENNGDIEAATDWLRTKGLAAAAKKSGRDAAEGVVAISLASDAKKAAVIELNSETDFVSRNETFQALAANVAGLSLEANGDIDALKQAAFPGTGRNVEEEVTENIATIGENLVLRRTSALSVSEGLVATYVHNSVAEHMGKIAVLVALESSGDQEKLGELGKQIAMHVAAAKPAALNIESVSKDDLEREKSIYSEQARNSGKPENIIEKMVEGRIRKYYEEVVLLEQTFVIDGKKKISELLEEASKSLGAPITLSGYVRFELGEGVEKKEEDFAAEVAAAIK